MKIVGYYYDREGDLSPRRRGGIGTPMSHGTRALVVTRALYIQCEKYGNKGKYDVPTEDIYKVPVRPFLS